MVDERLVFVDIEAFGPDDNKLIIQIAACALDSSLRELEFFEQKILPDKSLAWAIARSKRKPPRTWLQEGVDELTAANRFTRFLSRHATVDMISDDGNLFSLAQLAAYNAPRLDAPLLQAWYRRLGLMNVARYQMFCVMQRAFWLFREDESLTPLANYQLATVCEYFGIRLRPDEAHDAANDVRATVGLYRAMQQLAQPQEDIAA